MTMLAGIDTDKYDDASWSRKVFLGSQFLTEEETSPNGLFVSVDNTSNRCIQDMCPSEGPFTMALRWARILILKVARMYGGAPICLMVLPLLAGIAIGFFLGKRSEKKGRSASEKHDSQTRVPHLLAQPTWFLSAMNTPMFRLLLGIVPNFGRQRNQDWSSRNTEVDDVCRGDPSNGPGKRESGVDLKLVPKHVAVIMDGNRRYGRKVYGNATRGHWDGSKSLVNFAKWCTVEGVQVLTVYAFSTENWNRDQAEIDALMTIFSTYCEELLIEAKKSNIRVHVLSTDNSRIPPSVQEDLDRIQAETRSCNGGLTMNVCVSYGSRGELVNACRGLASDFGNGHLKLEDIDEASLNARLLTGHCDDPDVVIRTSGEYRLSNFLLWQSAYTEFFFLAKPWPAVEKSDLLEVIRTFANTRERRYGK